DHDHHVSRAREVAGDAPSRVILALEVGQDGMLIVLLDQLFLAPEIEPAVIVEGDDAGRGEAGALRYEYEGGHADVGRRVELDALLDVVAAVHALEGLRPR